MNKPTRGQKIIQKCKFCKIEFEARKADVDDNQKLLIQSPRRTARINKK